MKRPVTAETFEVRGMHCASCGMLIDETLEDVQGISASMTDVRRQTTIVEYDRTTIDRADVAAAIEALGYHVAGVREAHY